MRRQSDEVCQHGVASFPASRLMDRSARFEIRLTNLFEVGSSESLSRSRACSRSTALYPGKDGG